jgi:nicotinamidase-related amidase
VIVGLLGRVCARDRDWHSNEEPSEHFERFGEHCVANTPGAALVLGLEEGAKGRQNELFVNASKVCLCHSSCLLFAAVPVSNSNLSASW